MSREKHEYEVIVGNIGSVYMGLNSRIANQKFSTYVKQSKTGYGLSERRRYTHARGK